MVLRSLSNFLDNELPEQLARGIRKHLGVCHACELFVSSLRATVRLCRDSAYSHASPTLKARLRAEILKTIEPS